MINLLPPKLKQNIKFGSYNVSIIQYGGLVLIIGVALATVMTFGVQFVRADEANLRSSISKKETQLAQYLGDQQKAIALSAKITTISKLLQGEVKFSNLIQEIGGLLPTGARLTGLQLTNDLTEPFVLVAIVNSKEIATQLQQNLANSSLFIGADIQSLNPAQINDETGGVVNYSINVVVAFPEAKSTVTTTPVESEPQGGTP